MSEFVYFIKPIGMAGPVKIGCSFMPGDRLLNLSAWSPFPLEIAVTIPGNVALESNLHDCLFDLHSHREWFHESPRITDLIEKLRSGVPVEEAIDLSDIRGSLRGDISLRSWAKRRGAA